MNKIFLNKYGKRLLQENIFYIVLCVVFSVLIVGYIPYSIYLLSQTNQKNDVIRTEIAQLQQKHDQVVSFAPDEIDSLVSTLNTLVPSTEDYFSILHTLEVLSIKSGFIISSYKVAVGKTPSSAIKLSIIGEGSSDQVLAFLNEYRTSGGRLITIEKIEYSPIAPKVTLTLSFYAHNYKGSDVKDITQLNATTIQKINIIGTQTGTSSEPLIQESESSSESAVIIPQVKANPFE